MLNVVFVDVVEVWNVSDEEIVNDIDSSPPSMQQSSVSRSEEDRKMCAIALWMKAFLYHLRRSYGLTDAVTSVLLKFLAVLFSVLGLVSHPCSVIAKNLPSSVYMLQQTHSSKLNKFLRYVVCRKCDSVYKIKDCKEVWNASKKCQHVFFPNHPQVRIRLPCGSVLLKTVELASGRTILYPHLTYCYLSIKESLQNLLLRPSFVNDCERWRSRAIPQDILQDIYDGKSFRYLMELRFCHAPSTLHLQSV